MKSYFLISLVLFLFAQFCKRAYQSAAASSFAEASDSGVQTGLAFVRELISGLYHLRHSPQKEIPRRWRFKMANPSLTGKKERFVYGEMILNNAMDRNEVYSGRIGFYTRREEPKTPIAMHQITFVREGKMWRGRSVPVQGLEPSEESCIDVIEYELEMSKDLLSLTGQYTAAGGVSGKFRAVENL